MSRQTKDDDDAVMVMMVMTMVMRHDNDDNDDNDDGDDDDDNMGKWPPSVKDKPETCVTTVNFLLEAVFGFGI